MTRLAFCHWPNFRTFTFSYQVHRAGRGHSARYKVQQLTRIRQDRRTTLYQSVCYKVTTQSCPVRDCGLWAALHKFIALLQTSSLARPSALQNFACAAALLTDGPAGPWSEIRPQAIMSARRITVQARENWRIAKLNLIHYCNKANLPVREMARERSEE